MKTARIARTALLAALGLLLLAPLGAGAATTTPLKVTLPLAPSGNDAIAVDGTDVYWLAHRKGRYQPTSVMRGSLIDKSVVRVGKLTGGGYFEITGLLAGGGYAAVTMANDGMDMDPDKGAISKVVRFSRDGSSRVVVAAGATSSDEESSVYEDGGNVLLNDCGTSVFAMSMSATGAIVVDQTTMDRDSVECGHKKNVNHNHFVEIAVDGSTRELFSLDQTVKTDFSVFDGGFEGSAFVASRGVERLDVVNDRAIYTMGSKSSIFVKDLKTGQVFGPYLSNVKGRFKANVGSIDSTGRVASVSVGVTFTKNDIKAEAQSRLYPTPGDPNAFVLGAKNDAFYFCGDHLFNFSGKHALELDPATQAATRVFIPRLAAGNINLGLKCNQNFVYATRARRKTVTVYGYPTA